MWGGGRDGAQHLSLLIRWPPDRLLSGARSSPEKVHIEVEELTSGPVGQQSQLHCIGRGKSRRHQSPKGDTLGHQVRGWWGCGRGVSKLLSVLTRQPPKRLLSGARRGSKQCMIPMDDTKEPRKGQTTTWQDAWHIAALVAAADESMEPPTETPSA